MRTNFKDYKTHLVHWDTGDVACKPGKKWDSGAVKNITVQQHKVTCKNCLKVVEAERRHP